MGIKFQFLVLPQVHLMDLAGPDQVIHECICFGADFSIGYCGLPGVDIRSSAGLPFASIPAFSEVQLKAGDYLFIPGSNAAYLTSQDFLKHTELFDWIRAQHEKGVILASICAGSLALGAAGLLNGVTCTTHFKRTLELQNLYPKAKVTENILYAEQNGIYSSAGIASGIDMTLHIVEKLKGEFFAYKVAREMVIYKRRTGSQHQINSFSNYRNHIHNGIHQAQDYMHENMHKDNNIQTLAEIAGMSERNFSRVFKKETGLTVHAYLTLLRKEKIEELKQNPNLSNVQIANSIGLRSERQVQRLGKNIARS